MRAKGFGRAQILDSIADGLCRRREAPIFGAATLYGLSQEPFSRGAVIERPGRSRPATKFVLLGYTFVWLVGVLNTILECFAFRGQKLRDLIRADSALTAEVIHQLADLKLVAAHSGLLRCSLEACPPLTLASDFSTWLRIRAR